MITQNKRIIFCFSTTFCNIRTTNLRRKHMKIFAIIPLMLKKLFINNLELIISKIDLQKCNNTRYLKKLVK